MRRNYITHPRFQISFTVSFVLGSLFIVLMVGGLNIGSMMLLSHDPLLSESQQNILRASSHELMGYLLFLSLVSSLFFTWLGFYLSYKFIGPLFRLEKWLETSIIEKSTEPIKLRPGDELEKVSNVLNRMVLKKFLFKGDK